MHTENPLPPAQLLKIMPADTQIEAEWEHASQAYPAAGVIPRWGNAIAWHELHHTSPRRND
ncbi:hypothetical protein I6E37_05895 [Schaalia hyovaginalis]|nr:hypothetical protein [Schaalia hyovaginalis]